VSNNNIDVISTLINKIKNITPLTAEAEREIYSIAKIKSLTKSELILKQGHKVKKTFFVIDGCLRSFHVQKDGKEHTLQFAIKDWWISDFIALFNNEIGSLSIESITDSTVIEFNSIKLDETLIKFPELESFQRESLQRHVSSLHKRILDQLRLTALERYRLFQKQYSDIEQYAPNYHIASYLGITQQSLSRIRSESINK
jgi:CRP-like cAMP-binding protein